MKNINSFKRKGYSNDFSFKNVTYNIVCSIQFDNSSFFQLDNISVVDDYFNNYLFNNESNFLAIIGLPFFLDKVVTLDFDRNVIEIC